MLNLLPYVYAVMKTAFAIGHFLCKKLIGAEIRTIQETDPKREVSAVSAKYQNEKRSFQITEVNLGEANRCLQNFQEMVNRLRSYVSNCIVARL